MSWGGCHDPERARMAVGGGGGGRPAFTLDEVYAHEAALSALYPGNRNVRPKIRQQLQVLRDRGWLAFNGRGTYRRVG